mmetsp:Transcript_116347/g.340387  ORF Transcript_116347/g.340387 Transcript_116347/m.340387 type:complete len:142 (+) Transcript_116347:112-537(+)
MAKTKTLTAVARKGLKARKCLASEKSGKAAEIVMSKVSTCKDEVQALRKVLLSMKLQETVKWRQLTYVHKGKNIVGLCAFKAYFGLWFWNGVTIKDEGKVLINAQPGTTKSLRQWRMTKRADIKPALVKKYVKQAMAAIAS